MVNTAKNPMIQLHTYSEVREVSGSTGDFRVVIEEKARFVDPRKCTGCEACVSKCPTEVPSEFNKYVGTRKAIYVPFPQAVPKVALIDKNSCINCKLCSKTCQAGAIDYDQQPNIITTKVGAVIIATGWDEYNLLRHSEYGYGKYPNVITQAELERMLSPVGPTGGHVYRISDGKTPQKLAMIQCVGSRNVKTNPYCSGVCCMVAMKNAQILRQEYPDSEIAIFFIDIRATDKGNEEYFARIRDKDIKFIRGIIGEVREDPETQNLTIRAYSGSTDRIIKYDADLLVLSAGIEPSQGTYDIAKTMGLDKGPGGFLRETHGCLAPQETKTKGIYICGCAAGPKNIPYSVSSALAAAANAASLVTRGIFQQELLTPVVDVDLCMGCH
ncbi:MAG TPA: CoB--CoM heterodisulfide reductase iron-sulfur subunit A family protein, partial [Candidatus Lokiarchaeia archaeon]|nr:CoB--CoM heterodisulfide reductase iron-sulfur subunit A family protein [Candidatus Lokiarchaeia archaeon]